MLRRAPKVPAAAIALEDVASDSIQAHGPFVDKAASGGHNEKASLEL
jgi:hypothetical protein